MGAAALLAEARRWIGTSGRPNDITRDYASRHGDVYLSEPWCDMAVTYWARASGNAAAVLPAGDRAYTPWHADDFRAQGRWRSGTAAHVNAAKPGDIVFFDWGATNTISAIDHIGVIERVLGGGRVQTIEGNTGDAVRRRVRSAQFIAGYGRPAYGTEDQEDDEDMPEYVSVGVDDDQPLPPNQWVTVAWDREYADSEHHHWDKGGTTVVVGPARYQLMANLRIEGLEKGTELQARAIEHAEGGDDFAKGPICEYLASGGATFVHYALPADTVGDGYRVRFQIAHFGTETAQIVDGAAKAFAWPT